MIHTKTTIDWDDISYLEPRTHRETVAGAFHLLQQHFHAASYNRGWWHDPITGLSLIPSDAQLTTVQDEIIQAWFPYVIATKIALIHSETSEMLEAARTGKADDKVPLPGVTAEGADIIIRVLDLFGMMQELGPEELGYFVPSGCAPELALDLANAILLKGVFNGVRPDHALEARAKPGGKKY